MPPYPNNVLPNGIHKIVNDISDVLSFEQITVMDQIVCTGRQISFQILRNCSTRIGMNTTANKLYHLNDKIGLNLLNNNFHFKKLAKIQFLKYGKT